MQRFVLAHELSAADALINDPKPENQPATRTPAINFSD